MHEADVLAGATHWLPAKLLRNPAVAAADIPMTTEAFPSGPASIVPPCFLARAMRGPAGGPPCSGVPGLFNFEDFVRFSIAQADRMRTTSAAYWLDILDLDDAGTVGERDLRVACAAVVRERRRLHCRGSKVYRVALSPAAVLQAVSALLTTNRALRFGAAAVAGGTARGPVALTRGAFTGPGGNALGLAVFSALLAANGCDGLLDSAAAVVSRFPAGLAADLPMLHPSAFARASAKSGSSPIAVVGASSPRAAAAPRGGSVRRVASFHGGGSSPAARAGAATASSGVTIVRSSSGSDQHHTMPALRPRTASTGTFQIPGFAAPPALTIPDQDHVPGM